MGEAWKDRVTQEMYEWFWRMGDVAFGCDVMDQIRMNGKVENSLAANT